MGKLVICGLVLKDRLHLKTQFCSGEGWVSNRIVTRWWRLLAKTDRDVSMSVNRLGQALVKETVDIKEFYVGILLLKVTCI